MLYSLSSNVSLPFPIPANYTHVYTNVNQSVNLFLLTETQHLINRAATDKKK
ncbi:hypothetical protein GCM10007978_40700 [Shewanella hanedai]|nr:hypothetical protein GCM10007978_40700 [Shewanella hanedai]